MLPGGGAALPPGIRGTRARGPVWDRSRAPAQGAGRTCHLPAGAPAGYRGGTSDVSAVGGPLPRAPHRRAAGTASSGNPARGPAPVCRRRPDGAVRRRDRQWTRVAGTAARAGGAANRRHHDRRRAAVCRPFSHDREVRRLGRRVVQRRPVRSARAPGAARLRGRLPVARRVRQAADDCHGNPPFRAGTASGR